MIGEAASGGAWPSIIRKLSQSWWSWTLFPRTITTATSPSTSAVFSLVQLSPPRARASASIDLKIDEADLKAGKRIQCPVHVLWAANGAMGRLYDVLTIWKEEGADNGAKITGKGLPGSHSLQESAPKETLAELQQFLRA